MSKIGKKPITVPGGVDIKIDADSISIKGPKGELHGDIMAGVNIIKEDSILKVVPKNTANDKDVDAIWGLERAVIQNMIIGVTEGFSKTLEFQGIGYKANVKGNDLELSLGYSHPITIKGRPGITFKTEKNSIKIEGIDKELIGKVAAEIRDKRKPEPYKGSGIRYQGEVIKRKAGKKAVTAG